MGLFSQAFGNADAQLASQIQADPAAFTAKYKLDPSKVGIGGTSKLLPQAQSALQQYYATQNPAPPAPASPAGAPGMAGPAGAIAGAVAGSHPTAGAVCPTCGQPMPGTGVAGAAAPMGPPGSAAGANALGAAPADQSTDALWKNTGSSYQ